MLFNTLYNISAFRALDLSSFGARVQAAASLYVETHQNKSPLHQQLDFPLTMKAYSSRSDSSQLSACPIAGTTRAAKRAATAVSRPVAVRLRIMLQPLRPKCSWRDLRSRALRKQTHALCATRTTGLKAEVPERCYRGGGYDRGCGCD